MAAFLALALLASPALACIGGFGSGGCGAAAPSCGGSYASPGAGYPRAPVGYASAPSGYAQPPVFAAPAPINSYAAPGGFAAPAGGYAAPGGFAAPAGGYSAPAGGYSAPAGGYSAPAGGYSGPSGAAGPETQGPVAAGFGGAFADTGAQNGNFGQAPPPPPPPHQAPQGSTYIEGGQHPQPVISPATGENVQVIQPTVVIPEGTYQPAVVNPAGPSTGEQVIPGGQGEQIGQPQPGPGGVAPSFAQPRTTVTANRTPVDSRTFVPAPSHVSQINPQPAQIEVPGSSVSPVEISEPVIPPVEIQPVNPIVIETIPTVEVHTGKTAQHTSSLQHRPVHVTVSTSSESNPEPEERISKTNSNRVDQHHFKSEVDDIDTESASFLPSQPRMNRVESRKPKIPVPHTERTQVTTELIPSVHESIKPFYVPTSQNRQPQIPVEPAPYFEGGDETHNGGGQEGAGPREIPYEITHPIQPQPGHIEVPHPGGSQGPIDVAQPEEEQIDDSHIQQPEPFIPETVEPEHVEPEPFIPQTGEQTTQGSDEEYEPVQPAQPSQPLEDTESGNKQPIVPYQPEEEHITEVTEEEHPHQEETDGGYNAEEQPVEPHHDEEATPAPAPAPVATQAPQEVPAATENYDHQEQAGAEYEDAGANYDDAQPEPEPVKEEKSEAPYRH